MRKEINCDFEQKVIKSLKAGFKDEEISKHLQSCDDCRETAKIVGFFQTNLSREPQPRNLPTAGLVWWKAKLREKKLVAEKVAQPIFIAQIAAAIIGFFAVVGLLIYQPELFSPVAAAVSRTLDIIEQMAFSLFAGITTFAVISATIIFIMRRLMPEK